MAGEAVSRTSLTSVAFQKKQDLEWRKLRERLHLQLQRDIARIYTNSLYCDVELAFDSTSIQTHRSILQVRAARFFTKLSTTSSLTFHHDGFQLIAFEKASKECIESFIRNIYSKCSISNEEDNIVQYLEDLKDPIGLGPQRFERRSSGDSGLSPESDVYLTPNCSPSDLYHHFGSPQKYVTSKPPKDALIPLSAEGTISNLRKTNRSYYSIVPIDEVFSEDCQLYSPVKLPSNKVLEKELAEQDELLKSFRSIISKEEKKTNIKKLNKPTSLPFTSSHSTKKQKRGCDITFGRFGKKEGKVAFDPRIQLATKEDFTNTSGNKEFYGDRSLKASTQKKERYTFDKCENWEYCIQEEVTYTKDSKLYLSYGTKDSECETGYNNGNRVLDEEFMESPAEAVDCQLDCCKKKDDLCSPEMDASGGGQDSGLDTSSTGCIAGGFSSPREHTVSETSGVDLTEAAVGEDMPHDEETLLRRPVKSSTSSSVSSDAGTWDSTFPPTCHDMQETHQSPLDNTGMPLITNNHTINLFNTQSEMTNKELRVQHVSLYFEPTNIYHDNMMKENSLPLQDYQHENINHESMEVTSPPNFDSFSSQSEEKLTDKLMENCSNETTSLEPESLSPEEIQGKFLGTNSITSEIPAVEAVDRINIPNLGTEMQQKDIEHKDAAFPKLSAPKHDRDWIVDAISSNGNNFFINAADLMDESEVCSLPPSRIALEKPPLVDTSLGQVNKCDFVNRGMMDSFSLFNKHSLHEMLPMAADEQTFSRDGIPFLPLSTIKSDINIPEYLKESGLNSEFALAKCTSLKNIASLKQEVKMVNGQDHVAEFQREIKLIEHLEPLTEVRKVHGGRRRLDLGVEAIEAKLEFSGVPREVSTGTPEIATEVTEVPTEVSSVATEATTEVAEVPTNISDVATEVSEVATVSLKEEEEPRRPSLIRRNTFELDPDDDRLALLRQDYERRQGNLLFQNCIPQFSGHLTGSEGSQSLVLIGGDDTDEVQTRSLPAPECNSNLHAAIPNHGPLKSPHILPHLVGGHDIHTPDSLNNDSPLEGLFHDKQTLPSPRETSYPCDNHLAEDQINDNLAHNMRKQSSHEQSTVDLNMTHSSYDNTTKPVISGALTCNDIVLDEKPCDSPKKQKRTESTPIISGGVSVVDFTPPVRSVVENPIMSRRKNESAPILSGAAPPVFPEPRTEVVKPVSSGLAAWVVDMSDCSSAAKPPFDILKRRRKSDVSRDLQELQQSVVPGKRNEGFFFRLKETSSPILEKKVILKDKPQTGNDNQVRKSYEEHEMRSSGLGFFININEAKVEDKLNMKPYEGLKEHSEVFTSTDQKLRTSACGFYVDLATPKEVKLPVKEEAIEVKKVQEVNKDNSKLEKKNTLFSMFIDIGDAGQKHDSGVKSGENTFRGKVASSPHLSQRKFGARVPSDNTKPTLEPTSKVSSVTFDSGESLHQMDSPRSTYMYIDASTPPSVKPTVPKQPPVQDTHVKEVQENKKQGFFMFIEAESPVPRRKALPSGLRPNLNRHSWNPDARISPQSEEQRTLCRRHKRAHSLSVDRNTVFSPTDENKSPSLTSLGKSRMRGSSQSLHEANPSPDHGSIPAFGEEHSSRPLSSSCHARLSSRAHDKLVKRAGSLETQGEIISERVSQQSEGDSSTKDAMLKSPDTFNSSSSDNKLALKNNDTFDLSNLSQSFDESGTQTLTMDEGIQEIAHLEADSIRSDTSYKKDSILEESSVQGLVEKPLEDLVPDQDTYLKPSRNAENLADQKGSKMKLLIGVGSLASSLDVEHKAQDDLGSAEEMTDKMKDANCCSFVKLSDLDKQPAKTSESSANGSDASLSFSTNRMTRSIPETSWIESKLLMTRSIGSVSSNSKSLSRLFPHLHTTIAATSTPSNLGRSKSPGVAGEMDDNDTQISETSDLSSMQSSMGPSGLDGSTEETTDASSSYAAQSGPVSRLGEDLLRMFLEEINPDVTVEVGGRRLKAHKCILSSRCQYFAAMLSGGWVESAGNVISLQGFSYNSVHFALCHIYSGTSNIPDTISIVELATLADMLGLEGLKEVIMYTLKVKYCHFFHKPCTMCAVGVLECLPLAAAYGLDDIYRKSLRWITKYFVRIWPTKGFASLPRELVDKCYQQHVVHMSVDNILETVMSCDKLLATLPNVRWAEPVFAITSQLLEASIKYIANNLCGILTSVSFVSLGKEFSWNISRLEDSLMAATDRLPADQACQSYTKLHHILMTVRSSQPPPEMQWSNTFIEFLRRIQRRVESSLIRQAPRAARSPSWAKMDLELRKKIQEAACLVLVPGEENHRSRHASLARRSQVGSGSQRSVSSSGSRSLDLRQVKLAMTQQARRAASGGRVSTLKADTASSKSRAVSKPQQRKVEVVAPGKVAEHHGKKPEPGDKKPEHSSKKPEQNDKEAASSEPIVRPKTWPIRVLESKSRPARKVQGNPSMSSSNTPDKSGPRRPGKALISSSDSSRTSSPAMRRSASSGEGSARGRVGPSSRSRRRDDPDTPSVRRKARDEVAMSTDSLAEPSKAMSLDSLTTNESAPKSPIPKGPSKAPKVMGSPSVRRVAMAVSPRDSPTFKLRSGVSSSPYTGSPLARRSLAKTKSPTDDAPAKKATRPSSAVVPSKRSTPTRVNRTVVAASPARPSGRNLEGPARGAKKPSSNSTTARKPEEKPPNIGVGSRSGTFLKDEPTVLKKPHVEDVHE